MSRKATDPIRREEQARKYREMVAPYVGGELIEAVGVFERPFPSFLTDLDLIPKIINRESHEKKKREREGPLSDLSDYFVLAVTENRVYAFDLAGRYSKKVKDHVGDFLREDVSFSTPEDRTRVGVIELTEKGRKCRVEVRSKALKPTKNPWAAEVVAVLDAAGLSE